MLELNRPPAGKPTLNHIIITRDSTLTPITTPIITLVTFPFTTPILFTTVVIMVIIASLVLITTLIVVIGGNKSPAFSMSLSTFSQIVCDRRGVVVKLFTPLAFLKRGKHL